MNVEPSRWLDETFIFKKICHHFQHKSLGASSYISARIEFIKSFVSFNFFVHAWMKLGKIIVDVTISQPLTWVFQAMSSRNFSKSRKNPFFIFQK
jgi:hypothetical protein